MSPLLSNPLPGSILDSSSTTLPILCLLLTVEKRADDVFVLETFHQTYSFAWITNAKNGAPLGQGFEEKGGPCQVSLSLSTDRVSQPI